MCFNVARPDAGINARPWPSPLSFPSQGFNVARRERRDQRINLLGLYVRIAASMWPGANAGINFRISTGFLIW